MRRAIRPWRLLLLVTVVMLPACNLPAKLSATVSSSLEPTATAAAGWQRIADGLRWRVLRPNGDDLAQIIAVRIDPQLYLFRALYRPGDPQSLADWVARESDATLIINANFFDNAHNALGLVISDGSAFGAAYRNRGGTFLVRDGQPDFHTYRSPEILSVDDIEQAIQGFPLLVEGGERAFASAQNSERNRRTLIGQDQNGDILLMVSPYWGLSLADLSAYLSTADLNIVTAVNLDGGGSSMLALPDADIFHSSFDAVPAVLAVYPR